MTDQEIQAAIDDKQVTFTFTVARVNEILRALGKLPFENAVGIVNEIQMQGQPQVQALAQEVIEADKAAKEATDPAVVTDVEPTPVAE